MNDSQPPAFPCITGKITKCSVSRKRAVGGIEHTSAILYHNVSSPSIRIRRIA